MFFFRKSAPTTSHTSPFLPIEVEINHNH